MLDDQRVFALNQDVRAFRVRGVEGVTNLGEVRTKRLVTGANMTLLEMWYGVGGGVPLHIHRHETLGYVSRGRVVVTVGGAEQELAAGDAFIHPANVPHGIRAIEESTVLEIKSPVEDMSAVLTLEEVQS